MVQPITKAAGFLREVKAGCAKWNGVVDLFFPQHMEQIIELARQRKWEKARAAADSGLGS